MSLKDDCRGTIKKCECCEKEFYVLLYRKDSAKYCSRKCYGIKSKGRVAWNKNLTKETDERVRSCSKTLKTKYKNGIFIPWLKGTKGLIKAWNKDLNMKELGYVVWNKGKKGIIKSHRKGLTNKEEYGIEKANEIRQKISKSVRPSLERRKKQISETLKKKYISGELKSPFSNPKIMKKAIEKLRRPEMREHKRKLRLHQIFPLKDSKIEVKIQEYLKLLGVDFFTHHCMNIKHYYQCDILIPSMNLVIECDGDYWHHYPVGLEKDHIRTKELTEKGFKVLRLWEREINTMSVNDFEQKLSGV